MRILIVEDHPLFAEALCSEIAHLVCDTDIDVATSAAAALRSINGRAYDLLLVDLKVPGSSGVQLVRQLKKLTSARLAVITAEDDANVVRSIYAERTVGYLCKAAPAALFRERLYLLLAGAAVFPDYVYAAPARGTGNHALTDRERGVMRLMARGMQNKEIARELGLSIPTVKTHLKHGYEKLGVKTRIAASLKANELGLLDSADL